MKNFAWFIAAAAAIAVPACGDDSANTPDGAPPPPDAAPVTYTAQVKGTLADPTDLAGAQADHDGFAMAGEANANAAGDFGHQVLLGTTDFGTTEHEFLAIDQWHTVEGAQAVYGDPQFAAGLDALFAAPPTVDLYARRADWHSWGEMGSGRATGQTFWFVTVHGRLAHPTVGENQAAHDAVAAGGQAAAQAAGDIAHLPHLAIDDDREFFNVDIWNDEAAMVATFSDPDFQAQFQTLFEGPPEVHVYQSTDWYQWYAP